MNKPLYLFVGKSSSGKTTIAKLLENKYGYTQVSSYTTRSPRYENEAAHIFVTQEEFEELGDLAAYTYYNGHHYGATVKQVEECDIYVIDVTGIENLLQTYQNYDKPICIIYFDSTVYTRINRMFERHDSEEQIVARLLQDEKDDWYKQLTTLVWHYVRVDNRPIELYQIDANKNLSEVMDQVLYHMNKHKEE